jgi:hypothetical protein
MQLVANFAAKEGKKKVTFSEGWLVGSFRKSDVLVVKAW